MVQGKVFVFFFDTVTMKPTKKYNKMIGGVKAKRSPTKVTHQAANETQNSIPHMHQ